MQDVSVMGMIRRIFSPQGFSDLYVLIPAGIGCLLPLLRRKFFQNTSFQMLFLSLLMISTVIYSTGAESSTYIIAAVAVGIWYVIPASINANLKLIFLSAFLLISSIGTTDLMPNYIQVHLIRPYSLKALPVFIIWCTLLYEMLYKKFEIKAS